MKETAWLISLSATVGEKRQWGERDEGMASINGNKFLEEEILFAFTK